MRAGSMKLIFDTAPLTEPAPATGLTGVGRWTLGAIAGLSAAAPEWSIRGVGVSLRPLAPQATAVGPRVALKQIRFSSRAFKLLEYARVLPPMEFFVGEIDAMLGNGYVNRRSRRAADIPVIYDLSVIRFPETHPNSRVWYIAKQLKGTLERATLIVTISESVRREISERFGIDEKLIWVAPPGSESLGLNSSTGSIDLRSLPDEYLLSVGTLEPRKNLARLLEAHSRLSARHQGFPPLVVAGGRGWRSEEFSTLLQSGIASGTVRLLGYVDDEALSTLYRNATALVYPSLYEGFGMPVVEALAAGCPVITSNSSGTAEAAGNAALLVDPRSIDEIENAISRLVDDEPLRLKLKALGIERALEFSWSRTGACLKRAIETAVALKSGR